MYKATITGEVVSKIAFHVPVIRHWRLVMERREFGTKRTPVSQVIDLPFLDRAAIPTNGYVIPVYGDWSIRIKRVKAAGRPDAIGVVLLYGGIEVPGAYFVTELPAQLSKTRLRWHGVLYKGVTADLELVFEYVS